MNRRLLSALHRYFTLGIVNNLPALTIGGDLISAPALQAYFAALTSPQGLAPYNTPINYSAVTNASTTALTLTPANCANGVVNATIVCSGGSANTNTFDTANAIVNTYWNGAAVGAVSLLRAVNLNTGTMTLAAGTGITISGTATVPTLAYADYLVTCTNLANPLLPGSVATNTTTTTAAVAVNSGQSSPTSVIPVTSATGIVITGSVLGWVNTDGTTSYGTVTVVSSLNITVSAAIAKPIASGAAVSVFNSAIKFTRMYSTVTAVLAA
jgi:hypothetical protein